MVKFQNIAWSVIASLKRELGVYMPAFYDYKTGNIHLLVDEIGALLRAAYEDFPLQSHKIWASLFIYITDSSIIHEFCHGQGFNEQQAIAAAKALIPGMEEISFGDADRLLEGEFKEGVSWRLMFIT